jgi:hypothetical protein
MRKILARTKSTFLSSTLRNLDTVSRSLVEKKCLIGFGSRERKW